jgi:hypothetical protein
MLVDMGGIEPRNRSDLAIVTTQGIGRVTLRVPVRFLRWAARAQEWPELAEELARAVELCQGPMLLDEIGAVADDSSWPALAERLARVVHVRVIENQGADQCGVTGATTGRPCAFNTTSRPCPHHGEGSEKNRCGAATASGTPCRWNVLISGQCPSHPSDSADKLPVQKRTRTPSRPGELPD